MTTTFRDTARRMPTQERAVHTRNAILQATARILEGTQGKEPPSTNRIAKLAGVSVGTLYQYFDSREDIVRSLCRAHTDDVTAMLVEHAGPVLGASPREAVPAFVDALARAHAVAPRLHLALVRELMQDGGDLLAEVQDPARMLVYAWLCAHAHEIRPRDLEAAATLLTHTVEASIHGQLFLDPTRLDDPGWRAELVDLLVRYLVD